MIDLCNQGGLVFIYRHEIDDDWESWWLKFIC